MKGDRNQKVYQRGHKKIKKGELKEFEKDEEVMIERVKKWN